MVHLAAIVLVLALAYPWLRGNWFVPTVLSLPVAAFGLLFLLDADWDNFGPRLMMIGAVLGVVWAPRMVRGLWQAEPSHGRPVETTVAVRTRL